MGLRESDGTILSGGGINSPSQRLYIILSICAFLGYLSLVLMGFFSSKNRFSPKGKTAIVTGGSQGLGLSVAKHLASKGANVVIVAQDVPKLEAALEEIKESVLTSETPAFCAEHKSTLLCLSFDLRSPSSGPEILSQVTRWNNDTAPSIVWCCAGHCIPGFFANTPIDTLRGQMDTNYWSAAYMAHAALNLWLSTPPPQLSKAKPSSTQSPTETRHIIFTSSTLAFFSVAGYAPYSPAKAAMKSLSDTLVQEVAMHKGRYNSHYNLSTSSSPQDSIDIQIHTLFPMGILTPGFENENKLKPSLTLMLEKNDKPQHPDEVARIAVSKLEKGDDSITTMFVGHVLRGSGLGASFRNGIADIFWAQIGALAAWFVVPDFVAKCGEWGRENAGEHQQEASR